MGQVCCEPMPKPMPMRRGHCERVEVLGKYNRSILGYNFQWILYGARAIPIHFSASLTIFVTHDQYYTIRFTPRAAQDVAR